MTKGFSIYFALCIKNRMFYVLNDSVIATFSCLDLRLVRGTFLLFRSINRELICHSFPAVEGLALRPY